MTDHTDLAANTVRAKIDTDIAAKLSSWIDNSLDAYDLEDLRDLYRNAR